MPARRRVVELALRQLNAMAINVFDLLRFRRELLDAELASIDARRDYWLARAGYDALAAGGAAAGATDGPAGELRRISSSEAGG